MDFFYRFYSASQLPRLHRILALKSIGFSLQEIKSALEQNTPATVIEILESKQREVAQALREKQEKLSRIEFYHDSIKQEAKNME